MRVLLGHNRYRTPGGEEAHVDLLEAELANQGVDVRRLEVESPADTLGLFDKLKVGATIAYRPAGARLTRRAIKEWHPDVVHFHNLMPLLTPAALQAARRAGCAVVLTLHNFRFACPAGTLLRRGSIHTDCLEGSSLICGLRNSRGNWSESLAYGLGLELQRRLRLLSRWTDAFVSPSDFLRRFLVLGGLPDERIRVIHHGVRLAPPRPTGSGSFALYAGRLSSEKGLGTLLRAMSQTTPAVRLVIAGDGPLRATVEAAASDTVRYVGRLHPGSLADLRMDATCAVAPSECYEVFPLAALEALASGTPVVGSRIGGIPEIVGDAGCLFEPGDAAGLAGSLDRLFADPPTVDRLGKLAFSRAAKCFDACTQVRELRSLYESVAGSARPRWY